MTRSRWPKITRDTILFTAGVLGAANEAVFRESERPALLMLFAGMMGLPVFLRKDERTSPPAPAPPEPTVLSELEEIARKLRGDEK